jgi:X-X-X-Leu-X-X-Gly heptad repeat protein
MSEAQNSVNQLNAKLSELQEKVNTLRTRVNNTTEWWIGDTGTGFRESFGRACDYFNRDMLENKLKAHGQRLLKSVETQQSQDSTLAGKIVRH